MFVFLQTTVIVCVGLAIILTGTEVLGSQVPVHIDRTETFLVVGSSDWDNIDFEVSVVSLGDICSSLRTGLDNF